MENQATIVKKPTEGALHHARTNAPLPKASSRGLARWVVSGTSAARSLMAQLIAKQRSHHEGPSLRTLNMRPRGVRSSVI